MSFIDNFFFDLVKVWNASAQVATNWLGIPGVVAKWKYNFAKLIRLAFGIGHLNMDQLNGVEEAHRAQKYTRTY